MPKPAAVPNFLHQTQLGSFDDTLDIPSARNNKRHSAAAMHDIKEEKSDLTNSNPNANAADKKNVVIEEQKVEFKKEMDSNNSLNQ